MTSASASASASAASEGDDDDDDDDDDDPRCRPTAGATPRGCPAAVTLLGSRLSAAPLPSHCWGHASRLPRFLHTAAAAAVAAAAAAVLLHLLLLHLLRRFD